MDYVYDQLAELYRLVADLQERVATLEKQQSTDVVPVTMLDPIVHLNADMTCSDPTCPCQGG